MNVQELRDLLEGYDDDATIKMAHQPGWPMQEGVTHVMGDNELPYDEDDDEPLTSNDPATTVYLVCGSGGNDYAPRALFA